MEWYERPRTGKRKRIRWPLTDAGTNVLIVIATSVITALLVLAAWEAAKGEPIQHERNDLRGEATGPKATGEPNRQRRVLHHRTTTGRRRGQATMETVPLGRRAGDEVPKRTDRRDGGPGDGTGRTVSDPVQGPSGPGGRPGRPGQVRSGGGMAVAADGGPNRTGMWTDLILVTALTLFAAAFLTLLNWMTGGARGDEDEN